MIRVVLMVMAALTGALTGTQRAVVDPAVATDVVSVYVARQLDDATADRAITAAQLAGGAGMELNGGVLGLLAVRRGGRAVRLRPAGYRWPLSTAVMPPEVAGRIVSRDIARITS